MKPRRPPRGKKSLPTRPLSGLPLRSDNMLKSYWPYLWTATFTMYPCKKATNVFLVILHTILSALTLKCFSSQLALTFS